MTKRRSYADAVRRPVVRNEPAICDWNELPVIPEDEVKRPAKAPWSENGLLVGTRHFGELCAVNPRKSATVRVVVPDDAEEIQVIPAAPVGGPGSCSIL
jgi:hypothetical protein